jgi:hypothetical protein
VAAVLAYVLRGGSSGSAPRTGSATTLHFAVNVRGDVAAASRMGFDLFDVRGSTSSPQQVVAAVGRLPAGGKALVWVGNLDNAAPGSPCPAPGFSYAQFTAQVDALASDPRVYGYYLADEPHPTVCPAAAGDIRARAEYIHAHAPGQKAFIVVQDGSGICGSDLGCEDRALRPDATHVDLIGLDSYPCHYTAGGGAVPCDNGAITDRVEVAIASGIPRSAIVPVYQTFGQHGRTDGKTAYYRMPSTAELSSMLETWSRLVPAPAFDYPYTYGTQCHPDSCPAPQALENTPTIQPVVAQHNGQ